MVLWQVLCRKALDPSATVSCLKGSSTSKIAATAMIFGSQERRVDRLCRTDHEQRMAVRRCAHDGFCGDVGTGPRPVLDPELLAESLRKPWCYPARADVGRAPGGSADDQASRPRGIGLCPCDARHSRQRRSTGGQMQKISAGKFHFEPPLRSHHSITSSARATTYLRYRSSPGALYC